MLIQKPILIKTFGAGVFAPVSHTIIRAYHAPGQKPVVMATEPNDNPGMSLTNMAEKLAAVVAKDFPHLSPEKAIWIEHYPPRGDVAATFDRIEFTCLGNGRYANPSWRHIPTGELVSLLGDLPPVF